MAETPRIGSALIFRLGATRWFLPVESVVEVLRGVPITRVPAAAAGVRGLANHRGRVLTVANLGQILGVPSDGGQDEELVVVEAGGHRFAIAVDGVLELSSEPRTGLATIDLEQVAGAIFS